MDGGRSQVNDGYVPPHLLYIIFCFAWKAVSLVVVACDRFISFSMRRRYWLSGQFRELVVTGVFVTLAVQKYHLAQRHVQMVG